MNENLSKKQLSALHSNTPDSSSVQFSSVKFDRNTTGVCVSEVEGNDITITHMCFVHCASCTKTENQP